MVVELLSALTGVVYLIADTVESFLTLFQTSQVFVIEGNHLGQVLVLGGFGKKAKGVEVGIEQKLVLFPETGSDGLSESIGTA